LHEFYANATYKIHGPPAIARATVERFQVWALEPPTQAVVRRAWHRCDAAQINFGDPLIVAASAMCWSSNPFERGLEEEFA
jgi:hypothetical protein